MPWINKIPLKGDDMTAISKILPQIWVFIAVVMSKLRYAPHTLVWRALPEEPHTDEAPAHLKKFDKMYPTIIYIFTLIII